jgi:microcystin-dependent protein
MSYYRAKNRSINNSVFLQNRLTTFTNPPMKVGDLHVERDESVGNDLLVNGNLTIGNTITANSFYASGNYYLDNYILIPYGTIIQSAAINIPDGWLNCDGSLILRTEYINLFNAIGYAYSTLYSGTDLSFNVPNLQGRIGVGAGTGSGLTARNLGDIGGSETHTLTVSEMPSHSHTLTRRSNSDAGAFDTGDAHQDESSAATTDRADLGPFSTNSTGSGSAHNNMQPFVVVRYLIKY